MLALETRPLREVQQLLRDGQIEHALVVAAFGHLALALAELRRPEGGRSKITNSAQRMWLMVARCLEFW